MKAVMYHYIRPDVSKPPYDYYHLSLEDFRAQLDFFEEEFGFVESKAFLESFKKPCELPEGVVLTFDDGLIDHYEWVLPELKQRDLWGIFYVSTQPLTGNRALDVHRIHNLIGTTDAQRVLDRLESVVEERMIADKHRNEFQKHTYIKQDNADSVTKVKRLLNYYISYEHRSSILSKLTSTFPEAEIGVNEYYMTEGQLKELQESGMILGSHSVSHRVFSTLSDTEQRKEIGNSFEFLDSNLGELTPRTFCYPYGGDHTYNQETIQILDELGCQWSFNVESRDVTKADVVESPQQLPRYDCTEFPHGKATHGL